MSPISGIIIRKIAVTSSRRHLTMAEPELEPKPESKESKCCLSSDQQSSRPNAKLQ